MAWIEVAYATPTKQQIIRLAYEKTMTVEQAITASKITEIFPELLTQPQWSVGIFSHLVELTEIVQPGDRIEIYRPLVIDPKTRRRLLAKKAKASN